MVKITIENLAGKEIVIRDLKVPVLRHIHGQYIDWMHACGGKGRCTSCKMIVTSGMEHVSALTPPEKGYRQSGALADNERLACQVRISGDISIRVPEEYKLPHMTYTS